MIPANQLGLKTVLVRTGYGKENEVKLKENSLNSIVVNNISEFVNYIKSIK